MTTSVNLVGKYQAGLLKDDDWDSATEITDEETNEPFTFSKIAGPALQTEIRDWQSDWGSDKFGAGSGDAWKSHGASRAFEVDLPYLANVESEFREKETALGINKSGIIDSTFTEGGIDYSTLEGLRDDPEGAKSTLFSISGDSIGASGEWKTEDTQIKEDLSLDKYQANVDFKEEKEDVKDIRKEKSRALRDKFKVSSRGVGGLKRGGRAFGGGKINELMEGRNLSKEIGILSEKARKSYTDELEGLELDKDADIATNDVKFENKIETELRDLVVKIKEKEASFGIRDIKQEKSRYDNLMSSYTNIVWEGDPVLFPAGS